MFFSSVQPKNSQIMLAYICFLYLASTYIVYFNLRLEGIGRFLFLHKQKKEDINLSDSKYTVNLCYAKLMK